MSRQYITKETAIRRIKSHLISAATSVDVRLGLCIGLARRASLFNVADNLEEIMVELSEVNEELEKNREMEK